MVGESVGDAVGLVLGESVGETVGLVVKPTETWSEKPLVKLWDW